jgi:hypothetical protein
VLFAKEDNQLTLMKQLLNFTFCFFTIGIISAQDSSLLQMTSMTERGPVVGTFKATQIVNTPTIESPARRTLQFIIMHRFGKLNEGAYALFGLDNATIRFGLDYGITDRFSVGVGRSSYDKVYDGSVKYKLLRQTPGSIPVSVSVFGMISQFTQRYADKPFIDAIDRIAYTGQLLIARKFSSNLSLQLTPGIIHYNLTNVVTDKNDVMFLGLGGRMKISKRMSINAEYTFSQRDKQPSLNLDNSLSAGLDIETGGHVFQLIFTNSKGMIAPYYVGKTEGTWGNGDLYFGFNISRVFTLGKKW